MAQTKSSSSNIQSVAERLRGIAKSTRRGPQDRKALLAAAAIMDDLCEMRDDLLNEDDLDKTSDELAERLVRVLGLEDQPVVTSNGQ